jgi:hypothetical protein
MSTHPTFLCWTLLDRLDAFSNLSSSYLILFLDYLYLHHHHHGRVRIFQCSRLPHVDNDNSTTDYLSPNDASYPYGYLDDSSFLSPFFPGSSSPLSPLAGTGLSNFTPTTIGTSLPNTPGNASPLVGQKRSRSSQSPPYQHVTMDQVCPRSGYSTQKPAAVPYSTYVSAYLYEHLAAT